MPSIFLTKTSQVVENRAVGPIVAVATIAQMNEGATHGLKFCDAALNLGDVTQRQALDLGTGTMFVAP